MPQFYYQLPIDKISCFHNLICYNFCLLSGEFMYMTTRRGETEQKIYTETGLAKKQNTILRI